MNRRPITVLAAVLVSGVIGVATPASASTPAATAKSASATITARISGTPRGARALAVLSNGASAYGRIAAGKLTVKLPKFAGSSSSFSLHIVTSAQRYAGSVSFGKVTGSKTIWYGRVAVRNGATTTLPRITFSSTYGTMKLTGSAARLSVAVALKKVSSKGKPASAGRFGLGGGVTSKGVTVSSVTASGGAVGAGPGDDLDSDGIPNSLDIDDNGNGVPDPVDKSTGANGSAPTAQYDAVSSLGTDLGHDGAADGVNYNLYRGQYSNVDELLKHVSELTSTHLVMGIRAIAGYFSSVDGAYIRAGWVDCLGLAWCLRDDDAADPGNVVKAPEVTPLRWDTVYSLWSRVYGDKIDAVKWAGFTMKDFLRAAKAAGDDRVTGEVLAAVADQPASASGFGLYDDNVFAPAAKPGSKENRSLGADLWTFIFPRNGSNLLQNMKPGDVFSVNAIMNDGTTKSIAMTVAPYFVTAPTITTMKPEGKSAETVDYTSTSPVGAGNNPLVVSGASPTVDFTFWRPQRQRITGVDSIEGDEPLVDMGHLDYNVQIQANGFKAQCPNSSLNFRDSDGRTWNKVTVSAAGEGLRPAFTNDPSSDARASSEHTATLRIDIRACLEANGQSVSTGSTRYMLTLLANGQLGNDSNRNSATQGMYFTFE